jgi:uncharacterized protein (TIGR03437 family)
MPVTKIYPLRAAGNAWLSPFAPAGLWNFSPGPVIYHYEGCEFALMLKAASALCSTVAHSIKSRNTDKTKMLKPTRLALVFMAALCGPVAAQVFDNSGNSMLNGAYYFREVLFTSTDEVAVYGNIVFSGGTYTLSGAQILDCNQNGCSGPSTYSVSGTYTISASGFGFISEQLLNSPIYGGIGKDGVFVGSSTESGNWDLFIAAPVTSQGLSTLQGQYTLAFVDATGLLTNGTPYDALLQLTANGSGGIGTVSVSAYATSNSPTTQSISGVKYIVSNNAFNVEFPSSSSSSALIQGNEFLYGSADGSFVFGGSPNNFDMIVGVRTGSASGLGGLYYQAGMDVDDSEATTTGNVGLDTYYGSFSANAGVLVGHQRLQIGTNTPQGYTYADGYQTGSTNYMDSFFSAQYIMGNGGERIGLGIGPSLSVSVAVPVPSFSGSGVYINPVGVVNAASYAPFTAGVSRGELITLFGTNIGPSTVQVASTIPFPTTLGGVQVLINNRPAPIYYVSSTQVSVIVPYETTASVAQIQVMNNQGSSNVVTELVNATTPGIFTNPANGIGYAAAEHPDFSLVTTSHPAQSGETIAVYLTGLGDTFPSVADGAAGVTSSTSNTITAFINGTAATVAYAGLAPGLVGLYQVNVQIPSGLTAGDNYLDISGPDSYTSEALISIASGTTTPAGNAHTNAFQNRKSPKSFHVIRRGAILTPQS